jgi:hypothetical protein
VIKNDTRNDDVIEISFSVSKSATLDAINKATDLQNDSDVFRSLSVLAEIKDDIKEIETPINELYKQVIQAISKKAQELYGKDWKVIKGNDYSISRSYSGAVYQITDDTPDQFIKIERKPNTDEIENYIKENSKLPDGVDYNPDRSESIRVKLQ